MAKRSRSTSIQDNLPVATESTRGLKATNDDRACSVRVERVGERRVGVEDLRRVPAEHRTVLLDGRELPDSVRAGGDHLLGHLGHLQRHILHLKAFEP